MAGANGLRALCVESIAETNADWLQQVSLGILNRVFHASTTLIGCGMSGTGKNG